MDHDAADRSPSPAVTAPGARVALFGLGTVGSAVAARLLDPAWGAAQAARGHAAPQLVAVADLDLERDRGLDLSALRCTTDFSELVAADDIDIVIELMGGSGIAGDAVAAALEAGKSVVTANKDLVARRGRELEEVARRTGSTLRFEAAVMAGVPVLGPLVEGLGADDVTSLRGILNGTTNHILSTMAADAREYDEVLAEAQARGYAEADPASDVEGLDATYKLAILVRLAWGGWPDVDAIRRSPPSIGGEALPGITGVGRSHLSAAARLGLTVKLVARAERTGDLIRGAVTPMALTGASVLGATGGVTNVVEFDADPIGRVDMIGPGAGGPATSTAILSDVLAAAGGAGSTWGRLPPAGAASVADDLDGDRGWLVVCEGLGLAGFPDALREMALASTDEALVTRPVSLPAVAARAALLERSVTVYPVLGEA